MNAQNPLRAASALISLVLMGTALLAQEGTDFSGQWVLSSEGGPDIPVSLIVEQSVARTNVRGEPIEPFFKNITIVREFKGKSRSETYPIGVVSGTVPGGSVPGGRSSEPYTHLAVKWEGRTLVIQSGHHMGPGRETGDWAARQETWFLDAQGNLHIVIRTRSSTDDPRMIGLVYRRR